MARRKRHPNLRWKSTLWPESPGKRQRKAGAVHLTVAHDSKFGFRACAQAGKMVVGERFRRHFVCWVGKNPRVAIAGALRLMARSISRRKGAFARYS